MSESGKCVAQYFMRVKPFRKKIKIVLKATQIKLSDLEALKNGRYKLSVTYALGDIKFECTISIIKEKIYDFLQQGCDSTRVMYRKYDIHNKEFGVEFSLDILKDCKYKKYPFSKIPDPVVFDNLYTNSLAESRIVVSIEKSRFCRMIGYKEYNIHM